MTTTLNHQSCLSVDFPLLMYFSKQACRFPRRWEVLAANKQRLDQLPGPCHSYKAVDCPGKDGGGHSVSITQMEQILDKLVAAKEIGLKVRASVAPKTGSFMNENCQVGAQVMLIKVFSSA